MLLLLLLLLLWPIPSPSQHTNNVQEKESLLDFPQTTDGDCDARLTAAGLFIHPSTGLPLFPVPPLATRTIDERITRESARA